MRDVAKIDEAVKGAATELIHAGEVERGDAVPLTTPIYETTTFVFDNAQEVRRVQRRAVDEVPLLALHQSDGGQRRSRSWRRSIAPRRRCCSRPGMGATTTILMAHARRRATRCVCSAAIYGGTLHLLQDLLARFGITPRFVSLDELANLERVISDRTRLVWFESPINPTLRCVDVRRIAEACRARGVLSVIDNTFASPINQQPLALGVDLAMQSATKYLNGHSDVTGGVVAGHEDAARADREGAAAGRHGDGSAAGVRARPRAEDAAAARRAAQRERAGGRRLSRGRPPRQPGLLPRAAVASRITRSRGAR